MRRRRLTTLFATALALLAFAIAAAPAAAHGRGHDRNGDGRTRAVVKLEDLNSPKALATRFGDLYVGQGWAGPPDPVLKVPTWRARHSSAVTEPRALTDLVFNKRGGAWLLGVDGTVSHTWKLGDELKPVLNMHEYQATDPDPYNGAEDPKESNPNGLAPVGWKDVLVVDAANNDLVRVRPDGTAWTVARWTLREVSTAHLGDPTLPKKLPAEAVPTTVAIGPDGWAYVGQLVGFPGTPGAAKIWRVNPYARDAVCSVDPKQARGCSVWKGGFTAIFDIAFSPTNGALYVYELAKGGFTAFEVGFTTGTFPKAILLEVKHHSVRELARGELSQPGGVVATWDGRVFVTDGMFTGGRLLEIKRSWWH